MPFHVNPKSGTAARCRAKAGRCPFGGVEDHHSSLEDAQAAFEATQVMVNVGVNKRTIVLSDVDGTLVRSSLVLTNAVRLHEEGHIDLGDLPERWQADMKNEDLIRDLAVTYQASLSGRTLAFVKADDHVESLFASDENFYSTLKTLIEHKERGDEVVLISGSPDFLVKPFAERFGFKYYASKYHKDDEGKFTGDITLMAGSDAKQAVIQSLGIENYDEVIGLGDTASDGPLLAAAHRSILVQPTNETMDILKAKNIRIDEIVLD